MKRRLDRLGLHVLVEYYDIDPALGSKAAFVEEVMLSAAQTADMQYLHHYFHQFSPFGVTGIVAVQESHLSIHTWPEHTYAAVDVFTCGNEDALKMAIEEIGKKLKARHWKILEVPRGGVHPSNWPQDIQVTEAFSEKLRNWKESG
ncbi:MAG: adenosylmethionine decarboxylase [Bacteroidota bacterium]